MKSDCPQIHRVLGLDVAKDSVTLHDLASGRSWTVANTVAALEQALSPCDWELAVCEATGGHEDLLLSVLHGLSIPVHRGHGAKISSFARSFGPAKTDRIDARVLAIYGRERGAKLPLWRPVDVESLNLVALVRRRSDLVELRKIEKTRAKGPRAAAIAGSVARAIAFLDEEIAELDTAIQASIGTCARLRARRDVLVAMPGIGPTIAATLLALIPELGTLDRRAAASLAGVAPHPRDSGTIRKRRITRAGRRELRPTLFLAALTAVRGNNPFADFCKRLIQNGKAKLVAITAVMRKIIVVANARLAELNPQLT